MRIIYTFILNLAVIFDSIGLGSQSSRDPADKDRLLARDQQPPGRPPPHKILGCSLRQLGYLRLIPRTKQNLRFEFRRYVFPDNKPIRLRTESKSYKPVPNQEHIVLSTSDGDVSAIFEYSGILRGIYTIDRQHARAKINIMSGEVDTLTPDEIRTCPVGKKRQIFPHNFMRAFANKDSLQFVWNTESGSHPGSPPSVREKYPDRLPTSEEPPTRAWSMSPPGRTSPEPVLGYGLGQLGYVRLIPKANVNRKFEFRKYIFPVEKQIQLLLGNRQFMSVPSQEHIVLSTSIGEVFAILDITGFLRGIYKKDMNFPRIKIHMMNSTVENMTADEERDCQVGVHNPIFPHLFTEVVANCDSLQTVYH